MFPVIIHDIDLSVYSGFPPGLESQENLGKLVNIFQSGKVREF